MNVAAQLYILNSKQSRCKSDLDEKIRVVFISKLVVLVFERTTLYRELCTP